MEKLSELEDPRQPSNGTRHDFREILVIAVCARLSDADAFEDIALWGRLKADCLRRFLVLQNGILSQDTFLRVFRVLDLKQFEAVFRRWVGGIIGALMLWFQRNPLPTDWAAQRELVAGFDA